MATTEIHKLAIKTRRNMRRRLATKIRNTKRDNEKNKELGLKQSPLPTFWDLIQNKDHEDTYAKCVGPDVLQTRTQRWVMDDYNKLGEDGKREFRKELSELLTEEAGPSVRVTPGSSHSTDDPTQETLHYLYNKHKWMPY